MKKSKFSTPSLATTQLYSSSYEPYSLSEITEEERQAVFVQPKDISPTDLIFALWVSPQRTRIFETRQLLLN